MLGDNDLPLLIDLALTYTLKHATEPIVAFVYASNLDLYTLCASTLR